MVIGAGYLRVFGDEVVGAGADELFDAMVAHGAEGAGAVAKQMLTFDDGLRLFAVESESDVALVQNSANLDRRQVFHSIFLDHVDSYQFVLMLSAAFVELMLAGWSQLADARSFAESPGCDSRM